MHAGRKYIQDEQKQPWDGAASGHGTEEDVLHEMAVLANLMELACKS